MLLRSSRVNRTFLEKWAEDGDMDMILRRLIILQCFMQAASSKVQEKASKTADSEEMQSVQRRADTIAATVLAEIQHFNEYRVGDFKSYMQLYLNGQIEFFHQVPTDTFKFIFASFFKT